MTKKEQNVTIASISTVILLLVGLGWFLQSNDLAMTAHFAPRYATVAGERERSYEAVRRKTFEESKAYNDGMAQELSSMRYDYIRATDAEKDTLRPIIRHRVAELRSRSDVNEAYDKAKLPADLQTFVDSL